MSIILFGEAEQKLKWKCQKLYCCEHTQKKHNTSIDSYWKKSDAVFSTRQIKNEEKNEIKTQRREVAIMMEKSNVVPQTK